MARVDGQAEPRYQVRETHGGRYGVWDTYLVRWVAEDLSEYDAEVSASDENDAEVK